MKDLLELSEVERIVQSDPAVQTAWLTSVGRDLLLLHNRTMMDEARILWAVFQCWSRFPTAVTVAWCGNFFDWAKLFTTKIQRAPGSRTIKHKIAVYEFWLVGTTRLGPPGFDAMTVDYVKLLTARTDVNNDTMTPELWAALAESTVSVREYKRLARRA